MAIYTRTGDAGTTSLFTGQRGSKTHPRVEAYGTLDELNAALSLCACAAADENHRALLEAIQQQLFWFSAELASDSERPSPKQRYISSEEISALEAAIDRAMARVEPLHSFILPGRCEAASRLHFARTLARRAERRLVELAAEVNVRQVLMRYINRLSDCLYALARAEDSDAHQNNIIREVSRRYQAATLPSRSKEKTPVALSFHDLHQLTREGLLTARLNGKQVGRKKGVGFETKKAREAKQIIRTHCKTFGGTLDDMECMKLTGLARNTYYKYKRQIRAELMAEQDLPKGASIFYEPPKSF